MKREPAWAGTHDGLRLPQLGLPAGTELPPQSRAGEEPRQHDSCVPFSSAPQNSPLSLGRAKTVQSLCPSTTGEGLAPAQTGPQATPFRRREAS